MRLHSLGVPHTRLSSAFSHCAFSTKVQRWGPMMRALGYETVLYGIGQPEDSSGWSEVVEILTPAEQEALLGFDPLADPTRFHGDAANWGSPLYREFNRRLAPLLEGAVQGDDVVCLHFGKAHNAALSPRLVQQHALEPGIGYPECTVGYRIYESHAWMNWHLGRENRNPWLSEWVVPNYFDVADWPLRETPVTEGYLLYFGRLGKIKGLNAVWQIARARPDLEVVLCGQGDPSPWLTEPNIRYERPKHGRDRAALFHGARCVLMPTEYVEPFGGVAVEAMLTGTPVVASDHSVFVETIPSPALRARSLADYLAAIEVAQRAVPAKLREHALQYSMEAVGPRFDRVLQSVPALRREGFGVARP